MKHGKFGGCACPDSLKAPENSEAKPENGGFERVANQKPTQTVFRLPKRRQQFRNSVACAYVERQLVLCQYQ
jgi:hypothetical protein